MTGRSEVSLRVALIQTCLDMASSGLTFGTSGNASVRLNDDALLITPTGMAYDSLQPEDIIALKLDGRYYGRCMPSTEWRFHRDILQARTDIQAIVHAHSPFATALACRGEGIPSFHYMVAIAGGADIRCAPYATFGSQDLSNHAVHALDGRLACLLANHGQIALGNDLKAAFKMAGEVETLAAMYWRSQQDGEPALLGQSEMDRVVGKFQTYGSQNAADDDLTRAGDRLPD
jgi:L-fuculose-phosphate aldolase